jgi:quercetin dioxygenase-like cupin family protein
MTSQPNPDTQSTATLPPDDLARRVAIAHPDDPDLPHVGVGTGTYTILLRGRDTGGRYTLIDMLVPPAGGPPPHRHDFEELFTVLEGEIELTVRGETMRAGMGTSVNVPANAPHVFRNVGDRPARLLCLCTPPGQEDFFLETGEFVASRTTPPSPLSPEERAARIARVRTLAPSYRSEIL